MKKLYLAIALTAVALLGLVAWEPKDIQGPRAFSSVALACSADGKTIYAADLKEVWKSEDGGKSWVTITPK